MKTLFNSAFLVTQIFYLQEVSGQAIISKSIYFEQGSYRLGQHDLKTLNEVIDKFKTSECYYIKFIGYADTVGSESTNDRLSELRVNATTEYFTKRVSIDTSKTLLYVTWLGESNDGYDLHIPKPSLQQRCVDIVLFMRNDTLRD
jgi:outer membrane protein OmpA-like peptidoglycan-associated protein